MAIDTAKTLSTTLSQAVKNRYYDQLFLRVTEKKLVHKQLGQRNRKIGKGEGGYGTGVVYWTRMLNFPEVTAGHGEGVPTSAISASAVNVTGSTAQYDAAVSISDIIAYTSFGDVMKLVMERLAYNAGKSIDDIIRNAIGNSGTAQIALGKGSVTAIPATGTLSIDEIRKAVRTLKRNDAPDINGFYVAVAHPDTVYDIMADTSTGGWMDANKYTTSDKLFNGEVGKLLGVRFLETSNGFTGATSAWVASATAYHTSVFGMDAFGVTELQGLKTYIKGFGSGGVSDPTDKISTAGWKTTFGTAVLDSSYYVNIKHVVTSTA